MSSEEFRSRHIGPNSAQLSEMLDRLGVSSAQELLDQTLPPKILSKTPTGITFSVSETEMVDQLRSVADRNTLKTSMIGCGYYSTVVPPVIQRNVLENPAWYTAYTPYQPEISQGRLEALLNFQTMVADLTGTDIASASLLDEATAAAEAMALARRQSKSKSDRFIVDSGCHPQVIAVVQTRAEPIGIEAVITDFANIEAELAGGAFGILVASPASTGALRNLRSVIDAAHAIGALACATTDLLACLLLESPGAQGTDVVVGSAQRFGVPMGFGGPHAGFMGVVDAHKRALPGRLVGVSVDAAGRPAMRLALQTREQHIRREKATSNICTAQVLLAIMSGLYACWHGPTGLRDIAGRVHARASTLAGNLISAGFTIVNDSWFDTLLVDTGATSAEEVLAAAGRLGINLRLVVGVGGNQQIAISCDETTTEAHLATVLQAFGVADLDPALNESGPIPEEIARTTDPLTHPIFSQFGSETEMLRYLRRLADKDLALDRTMIPLGSCTMKLNATTEMIPVTWPEFANMHPYAPADQTDGYRFLIADLERELVLLTGYDAVSLQPNAGSQGEFAGLLAIRSFHHSRGEAIRDICLIPASAHGTNAASAAMCGMKVVVVACDESGNIDMEDLRSSLSQTDGRLAAMMVTYPSTHGVFEESIVEICEMVHTAGGQLYLDGANFNALAGLSRPGEFGADVSHLNLHKTFAIPHGGGGPGVGPVCVKSHLAPFLPGHPCLDGTSSIFTHNETAGGAVSAAPYGSAGVLPIAWSYIKMMGFDGVREATTTAIVSANYLATRLSEHFPILYRGANGRIAHECIVDLRPLTAATGVTVDDVAKRLIDYGFHAPTMSFPVAGTLMIEPTESEPLAELDRFCDAMAAIKAEIDKVGSGLWPKDDNPLCRAPHTAEDITVDEWTHSYSRQTGAYPLASLRNNKYWPPVSRIDGAYGDRNIMCSCPPIEAYQH